MSVTWLVLDDRRRGTRPTSVGRPVSVEAGHWLRTMYRAERAAGVSRWGARFVTLCEANARGGLVEWEHVND